MKLHRRPRLTPGTSAVTTNDLATLIRAAFELKAERDLARTQLEAAQAELEALKTAGGLPTLKDLLDAVGGPKMLRETVCIAQTDIARSGRYSLEERSHINRLGRLANILDRCRPLDLDGRHGDLHTPLCGCEQDGAE